jgi:hypothetical protein
MESTGCNAGAMLVLCLAVLGWRGGRDIGQFTCTCGSGGEEQRSPGDSGGRGGAGDGATADGHVESPRRARRVSGVLTRGPFFGWRGFLMLSFIPGCFAFVTPQNGTNALPGRSSKISLCFC